jgi:hypothetical protein
MNNDEDFDIEEPTIEEDLEALLNKIETDLNLGRRNVACLSLSNIQGEKYRLLKAIQRLNKKYEQLKEYCREHPNFRNLPQK